jgi:hypothetical protein
MANELEKNINFEEISSNPELVKQLKQVHALLKLNGSSNGNLNNEKNNKNVNNRVSNFSLNDTLKLLDDSDSSLVTNKRKFDSIKSNADIREVFTLVNGLSKNNSISSTKHDAELTFPPIVNKARIVNAFNRHAKVYKLPPNLSDKLNTLIVPLSRMASHFDDQNDEDEKNETRNIDFNKSSQVVPVSYQKKTNNLNENSKVKINYVKNLYYL